MSAPEEPSAPPPAPAKKEKRAKTPKAMKVLMEEFRALERVAASGSNDLGLARVDLIGEELTRWRLCLRFKAGSILQSGLDAYGEMLGDREGRNVLDLRLFFPDSYPEDPPEVLVHEPRLAEDNNTLVSPNGVVHSVLLGHDWSKALRVVDVLKDTLLRLQISHARVDQPERLVRPYYGKSDTAENCPLMTSRLETLNSFDKAVHVLSSAQAKEEYGDGVVGDIEHSDRISLSHGVMSELYTEHTKYPIIFELRTHEGRVRHMGISEVDPFIEYLPSDTIIAPDWVVKELCCTPTVPARLRCVELPAIQTLLLQPRTKTFYEDMQTCQGSTAVTQGTQAILNAALRDSKLTALTVNTGTRMLLPVPGKKAVHMFEVLDVHPTGAVRLISSDSDQWEITFKVDFAPAPDHEDDDDKATRRGRKEERLHTKKLQEEKKQTELEKQREEERHTAALMQRLQIEDETPSIGKKGEIDVKIAFPDGKVLDAKFSEGMKVRSVAAFAVLHAPWTEEHGLTTEMLKLSTAFPKKTLSLDADITKKELHRQRILISEGDAAVDDDDSDEDLYVAEDDVHAPTTLSYAQQQPAAQMEAVRKSPPPAAPPAAATEPYHGLPPGLVDDSVFDKPVGGGAPAVPGAPSHTDPLLSRSESGGDADFPRSSTSRLEQAWQNSAANTKQRDTERREEAMLKVCVQKKANK